MLRPLSFILATLYLIDLTIYYIALLNLSALTGRRREDDLGLSNFARSTFMTRELAKALKCLVGT